MKPLPQHVIATETVVLNWGGPFTAGTTPEVLLIQRGCEPYQGMWALPGGFLEKEELPEEGAARELYEETNLSVIAKELQQRMVLTRKENRPQQTIVIVYSIVVDKNGQQLQAGDDATDVAWVPMDELPPLAANHLEIIRKVLGETYYDTI